MSHKVKLVFPTLEHGAIAMLKDTGNCLQVYKHFVVFEISESFLMES